jgi:glyoxylase-like metal-dependent hydrolase (beta-lactamase superfamily II)
VLIVPTPGHTPHHVSVLVSGDVSFLLAGDTSYNERLLLEGKIDASVPIRASPNARTRILRSPANGRWYACQATIRKLARG